MLGRKRPALSDDEWRDAMARSRTTVPDTELDDLIDKAVDRIAVEVRAGRRLSVAWSGGKDSLALLHVARLAGVTSSCYGNTSGLEFPVMTRWVRANAPDGMETISAPLDLHWLARNPDMLFPHGVPSGRWMKLVQHAAQATHFKRNHLDAVLLGRRRKDGNWVGRNGEDRYSDRNGVHRWSPIADWSHEAVLALIVREGIELPPCYDWPQGFYVGSVSAWARRDLLSTKDNAFRDVWNIDPDLIREAAPLVPAAREWMTRTEKV